MTHTRLVLSRSYSTHLIRSRDSINILSFSNGIPAGLLQSSSNAFSSFWRRSIQGLTWSSSLTASGTVTFEWLFVLDSITFEGCILFGLLHDSNRTVRIKAASLTNKAISNFAKEWIFLLPNFSLTLSIQLVIAVPEIWCQFRKQI